MQLAKKRTTYTNPNCIPCIYHQIETINLLVDYEPLESLWMLKILVFFHYGSLTNQYQSSQHEFCGPNLTVSVAQPFYHYQSLVFPSFHKLKVNSSIIQKVKHTQIKNELNASSKVVIKGQNKLTFVKPRKKFVQIVYSAY